MSRLRSSLVPLAVFVLALVVRCIGFGWGLPEATRWGSYHPDESTHQIVGAVFSILRDGPNPHFFNYPSLSIYATGVIYFVLQIAGLTTQGTSPNDVWPVVRDIIVAGRLFSVLCGSLTAVCAWGMAKEVGLRRGALLSGILLALCPGLVQHSHFATVDVPATFFVAACLWATLRAMNHPQQTKWWIWSAILAGLAAGTKYNAGLVIIAPLVALAVARKSEDKPAKWLFPATIGLAALAFFVSTPYSLLSFSEFWGDKKENGFAYELLVHPRQGSGDIFEGTGLGWIYHLTFNLPFVLTWPLLIAGLAGVFWAAKDRRHWPLLAFALIYFLIIGASNVRFMRYTFLLVPPLLLWASIVVSRLPKPRIWASLLAIIALIGTENVLYPLVTTDPRDQAVAYLRQVGGNPTLIGKPWFYTPPFQPNNNNVPVPGVKIVGFDASKINPQTDTPIVSEYEVREAVRLHPDGPEARFLAEAKKQSVTGKSREFGSIDPAALPGREFEPHDYLYTHPHVWLYR
ncbi:hypothetical protein IAD21_01972 [Abditibacteriota bacterium]|nr:hypothetical protein IAD21_01972 [Abditibacteriota bacterium]